MKVLVTGAAGFIGSHTALALLARGDDVVAVDEVNDYYDVSIKEENLRLLNEYGDRCKFYKTDLCDETVVRNIFETEKLDMVCHLAGRAGVRPSIQDPLIYVHSNVRATTLLLMLSHEFKVKNFVFASSSSVYGKNEKVPFAEKDAVISPVSPYAATKRSCELLASCFYSLYQFPISALRFFTVYGPRGRPDMAPYIFINNILHDIPIKQFGDGSSYRDYTYIDDIVAGVLGALDNPRGFEIYNLGRGDPVKLADFIALVEKCVGKKATIHVLPEQPGDVPRTFADIKKAQEHFHYSPKISFEEGIRRTVEWFKSRPKSS